MKIGALILLISAFAMITIYPTSELTQDTTKSGISMTEIYCKKQLVVIIKAEDNSPVCVKEETAKKLVLLGWAHAYDSSDNGIELKRSFDCVPEPNSNTTFSYNWSSFVPSGTQLSHTSTMDLSQYVGIHYFKSSSYCGISYCYGQDYCNPNIQLKTKVVITTSIVKKTECSIETCNQARAILEGKLIAKSPVMKPNVPYYYLFYFDGVGGKYSLPLTLVYQNSISPVDITLASASGYKNENGIVSFEVTNHGTSDITGMIMNLNNYSKVIPLCPDVLYTRACDGFSVIVPTHIGGGMVNVPRGILEQNKVYNFSIVSQFRDGSNATSNTYILAD